MFTPNEYLYINTNLKANEGRIYYDLIDLVSDNASKWFVVIKLNGRYTLEFKDKYKAMNFLESKINTNGHNVSSFSGETITLVKRDRDHSILIDCGQNKELAIKLVKHFRKQYIKNKNEVYRQTKGQSKTEDELLQQKFQDEIDEIRF